MTVNVLTAVSWDEPEERYYVLSCSPRRAVYTTNDIINARRRYNLLENKGLSIIVSTVFIPVGQKIELKHFGILSVILLTHDLDGCVLRAASDYLTEPEYY